MDLRLRGLAPLDPLAVPLPVGTEVVTRVDRAGDARIVPQGAVGRVIATRDDEYEVRLVSGDVATYRREELTARKVGQARFARRRAAAWDALRRCAVLEATVGSRAWGLHDEDSDVDVRGGFLLPFPWTTGLVAPPDDLVSADGSVTLWEVGKLVRQALRGDPNTLEMLFVPSARALDPVGEWILEARDAFVSSEIYGTFGRYAISQAGKLTQSLRLADHRRRVVEWLRDDPALDFSAAARRLAEAARVDELRAREYVKQLYGSLHDQGLLPARDFAALAAWARDGGRAVEELPRELRPKNAYNLLRLLLTAVGWLRSGRPSFVVEGPWRARLLAVKRGEVPLEEVLAQAEDMAVDLEAARGDSRLPARPDLARADALLRRAREEAARRWSERARGPWGDEAPEPPEALWEG